MSEREEIMACGAEDALLVTVTGLARLNLKQAVAEYMSGEERVEPLARRHVLDAMSGIHETKVARCPFEGRVLVEYRLGERVWECPVCGMQHVDDYEEEEEDADRN